MKMARTGSRGVTKRVTRRRQGTRRQSGGGLFNYFRKSPLTSVATPNYKPVNSRVGTSLANLNNRRAKYGSNKNSQNWLATQEKKYPHIQTFLKKQAEILNEIDGDANPDEAAAAINTMAQDLAEDPNGEEVQDELDEAAPVSEGLLDAVLKMSPADAKSALNDLRSGRMEGFKEKYPAMYLFLESSYNYLVRRPMQRGGGNNNNNNNNRSSGAYTDNGYMSFSSAFLMVGMGVDMGPFIILVLFLAVIIVGAILAVNTTILGYKLIKYLVKLAIYNHKTQIIRGEVSAPTAVTTNPLQMTGKNPMAR